VGLLLASAGAWAVVLAPFAVHNALTGAPGTLVSTNGGLNLYLGFHEGSRGGFDKPPELVVQEDPTGQRAASLMSGHSMTPAEASRFWMQRAFDWIGANPGRALLLELRKLGLWLGAREQPQLEVYPALRSRHPVLRWAPLHFGWFVALGGLGLFLEWRRGRFWRRWGLWIGVLAVCLFTSLVTFAVGRFRLPAWTLMSLPAGAGIACLVGYARRGRAKNLAYGLAAAGAILLATELMPRADFNRASAHFHHSLAQRHMRIGELETALEQVDIAMSFAPDTPFLDHTRGAALASLGRQDEAIRAYQRSLSRTPHPKTLRNLGTLYGKKGRHEEALRYLRQAAQIRPDDPALLGDLGVALWENRLYEEAREVWLRALKLDPYDERLRNFLELSHPSE
jgi:tetratricopeptide (TPR) repeat protein